MPTAPLQFCVEPGCPNMVAYGRCEEHLAEYRKESDSRRPNGYQRGYTRDWAAFSKDFLNRHPWCECDDCMATPFNRPRATDVDHTDGHSRTCPHAYEERHLTALSHAHHAKKTATGDGGFGRQKTRRCQG